MEFLATPEENADLILSVHAERPLRATATVIGVEPETYMALRMTRDDIRAVLRHPEVDQMGVMIFLREAALPGDFIWTDHPDPRAEKLLMFGSSLCVRYWAGAQVGRALSTGVTDILKPGEYESLSLDASVPRRLRRLVDAKLRKLCPYRAIDAYAMEALRNGTKTPTQVRGHHVHVSEGARHFRQLGGRWTSSIQDVEMVPLELESSSS